MPWCAHYAREGAWCPWVAPRGLGRHLAPRVVLENAQNACARAREPSLVLTVVRRGVGQLSSAALRTRCRPCGTGHVAFEPAQRLVYGWECQRRVKAGEVAEVADAEAPQVLELAAPAVRHW